MRRITALAFLLFAAPAFADELLTPADYLVLMEKSKLRYDIGDKPSKNPIEEMTCPPRDEGSRVIAKGDVKSLVDWNRTAEATKLLEEGERFYQSMQMKQAAEKFQAAIDADPEHPTAYFFYGDALLFGSNDAAAALEQYQKGIALDPTLPIGHFFASSALRRLGRMDEAREEIVQALVFNPSYETIWKIGTQNPDGLGIKPMVRFAFEPPAGSVGKKTRKGIDVSIGKDGEWAGYAICKAARLYEPQFQTIGQKLDDPGMSLDIERECVLNHLMATINATQAKLEEERKTKGEPAVEVSFDEAVAALPPREKHIHEIAKAKHLDGYVIFEIMARRCPLAASMMPDDARKELEAYVRKYVVVAKE